MHERHSRAGPPEIERCFSSGISSADNNDVLVESFVPFAIDVRDMRKIFAWNTEVIRRAEITGSDDYCFGIGDFLSSTPKNRPDCETRVALVDRRYSLVLTQPDSEVLNRCAIID